MLDISLFLLGLNVTNIPVASGDFTQLGEADAANGAYTLNGSPCALEDIFNLTGPDSTFNPETDIVSGGILRSGGTVNINLKDPLLSTLLASGYTVVLEYYLGTTGVTGSFVHDPDYNLFTTMNARNESGGSVQEMHLTDKDGNGIYDEDHYPLLGQVNRTAFTVTGAKVCGSTNGSAATVYNGPGLDPLMSDIVFSFSADDDSRLRSFAFYEPVDDADLPALSSL